MAASESAEKPSLEKQSFEASPDEPNKVKENYHETILTEREIAAEVCNLAGNPTYCRIIRAALNMESMESKAYKSTAELNVLPMKDYLDQTVVPILLSGLCYLSKERPPEPIIALAEFLIKHYDDFNKVKKVPSGDAESSTQ